MSLTSLEKRTLQRTVQEKIESLDRTDLNLREKREMQRALDEALSKLLGEHVERRSESNKFNDLVAGKFNNLSPQAFLHVLEEVVREIGGDIEPVKTPTVHYIKANQEVVLESAVFSKGK